MKELIYLAQSDTTIGLLSNNATALNIVKKRATNTPILIESSSLDVLKSLARVPKAHKRRIRYANKTSFIYKNSKAIRLVRDEAHLGFLKDFGYLYSTSANLSAKRFDRAWAYDVASVIVADSRGFVESRASSIYKLGQKRIKKMR